jgi:hypothetical protein
MNEQNRNFFLSSSFLLFISAMLQGHVEWVVPLSDNKR